MAVSNEGIILSCDYEDVDHLVKAAINEIIRVSGGKPELAVLVCEGLVQVNWQEVIYGKKKKEEDYVQSVLDNGGGYCAECKHLCEHLYLFSTTRWQLLICYSCHLSWQRAINDRDMVIRMCDGCHIAHPVKDMRRHEIVQTGSYGYCPTCFDRAIKASTIICSLCGVSTVDHVYGEICTDCCAKYPQPVNGPQSSVVSTHLERALRAKTPATLTVVEWLVTLNHFEGRCAYCDRKPYEALEHYMPINLKGGTTQSNCVPACKSCNSKKGIKHPDTIDRLFPRENLSRIRSYLASVASEQEKAG